MKRRSGIILSIMLSALLLTGCCISIEGGNETGPERGNSSLRVTGTARRNSETGLYEFISADITLDHLPISEKLYPVYSRNLVADEEENVLFEYRDYLYCDVDYESKAKDGFVFDSWKVTPIRDIDTSAMYYHEIERLPALLREIEGYLDEKADSYSATSPIRRYSQTLHDLPVEYLPYLVAEYDPEPIYVSYADQIGYVGTGRKDSPYSISQFRERYGESKEINAILKTNSTSSNDLDKFIAELYSYRNLEELHLVLGNRTHYRGNISILDGLKSVHIENVDFSYADFNGYGTDWKFSNCSFDKIHVNRDVRMTIENSKLDRYIFDTPNPDLHLRNTPSI